VRGKLRYAIILAGGYTQWAKSPTEQLFVCAPLFTVDKPKFTQRFVVQAQAFRYPNMFYTPECAMYHIKESICRFETIQVAHGTAVESILPQNTNPIMLSSEFLGLLRTHFITYLGGTLDKAIKENVQLYGEYILEEAKRNGVQ